MRKVLSLVLAMALGSGTLSFLARAHKHIDPDGTTVSWYPKQCCHDRDCQPVASIRRAQDGMWVTTVGGETVFVGDDETRRPSLDARWHVCLGKDIFQNVIIWCVFEPPNS
jgi:hypothetical protein